MDKFFIDYIEHGHKTNIQQLIKESDEFVALFIRFFHAVSAFLPDCISRSSIKKERKNAHVDSQPNEKHRKIYVWWFKSEYMNK